MKRNFSVLGAILALALSACNGESKLTTKDSGADTGPITTQPPIPQPTPTRTSDPEPTPVGDLYTGPAEVAPYVQKFVDDGKLQGVDVTPEMKNPTLEIRVAS
ncbi:MAG: hypothetical protein NDJ90_06205, partial [Oligoflexia bacterium]|nr:hypothetical protein [Oligoflexia bacterium]